MGLKTWESPCLDAPSSFSTSVTGVDRARSGIGNDPLNLDPKSMGLALSVGVANPATIESGREVD